MLVLDGVCDDGSLCISLAFSHFVARHPVRYNTCFWCLMFLFSLERDTVAGTASRYCDYIGGV